MSGKIPLTQSHMMVARVEIFEIHSKMIRNHAMLRLGLANRRINFHQTNGQSSYKNKVGNRKIGS